MKGMRSDCWGRGLEVPQWIPIPPTPLAMLAAGRPTSPGLERGAGVDEEEAREDRLAELEAGVDARGDVGQRRGPHHTGVGSLGEQLRGRTFLVGHVLGVITAGTGDDRSDLDHQHPGLRGRVADGAGVGGAGRARADDQDVDRLVLASMMSPFSFWWVSWVSGRRWPWRSRRSRGRCGPRGRRRCLRTRWSEGRV